jgi:hypothetical protein
MCLGITRTAGSIMILVGEGSRAVARAASMEAVAFTEEEATEEEATGEAEGMADDSQINLYFMNLRTLRLPSIPVLALGLFYVTWLGQVRGDDQPAMSQRTFTSPAEATNELVKAAQSRDRQAIREIFGPEITNLLTGDKTLDEKHFDAFASDLAERCDAVPEGTSKVILEISKELWSFPIPLIETNGGWVFDTMAGEEEIINRHVGRDEYYAIGVCRAYVKAQREYAGRFAGGNGAPRYAEKFRSTPGKMDGLYWPADIIEKPSPFSPFVAEAGLEGYHWGRGQGARPFHGYFFKILTRQGSAASGGKMNYVRDGEMTGGFALVAYPVRWGESGIMTFIVNQDGVVYQRSLGEKTARTAAAMKEYNPDTQWTVVQEPGITDLTGDEPAGKAR